MKKVQLTKKEILSELKKMGINVSSEVHSCLVEYEQYSMKNYVFNLSENDGERRKGIEQRHKA